MNPFATRSDRRNAVVRWALGAVLLLTAPAARAQTPDASPPTAQALFDAGMQALTAGFYSEACPRLEQSWRLEPRPDTRFYLADCYEKSGKTASAWINFWEVSEAAFKAGDTARGLVASQRALGLTAHLSFLTVSVPHPVNGLVVKRDGTSMSPESWGVPIPVDPGSHQIEATAPDKKPYQTTVEVVLEGEKGEFELPALQSLPPKPKPPPVVPPAVRQAAAAKAAAVSARSSRQKTLALISASVGVVGLGVGTALVLSAKTTYSDADAFCDANNRCTDPRGVSLRHDAISRANLAAIPFGIGLAGLGVGLTLWLTAPSTSKERPRAGLFLSPTDVTLRGRF
jgi:serine/threonine-protein kinase